MFSITKPKLAAKELIQKKNSLGLTLADYQGAPSTLCGGCGHDAITAAIIQAAFEADIPPHRVAKMSGIGCSSKTPAYFLSKSHGFNSVHGRMPSVTTGAHAADRSLFYLAVSGDGDTGSIGLGQFMHAMRRNISMTYIIENNGVYGLTKGQFSAIADKGAKSKKGEENPYLPMDPVVLAIELGCSFVGRGFSGDKQQLVPMIKAAMHVKGFALLDVLSPCVSFNNHEGSTKSYQYIRDHEEEPFHIADYVPVRDSIVKEFGDSDEMQVTLHDGSMVKLVKTPDSYDIHDKEQALQFIKKTKAEQRVPTGIFYVAREDQNLDFHQVLQSSMKPLRDMSFDELCPKSEYLKKLCQDWR